MSELSINEIRIEGLFGEFDHRIPLDHGSGLTVIYGPNGIGKTTVLRAVNSTLRGEFASLRGLRFRKLALSLSSGETLELVRSETAPSGGQGRPKIELQAKLLSRTQEELQAGRVDADRPSRSWARSLRDLQGIELDNREAWFFLSRLRSEMVHNEMVPNQALVRQEPDWFKDLRKQLPVRFIDTQRLRGVRTEHVHPKVRDNRHELAVEDHAEFLRERISQDLAAYGSRSQTLDRSFPSRLIERLNVTPKIPVDLGALRQRLTAIEQKRTRLEELGLVDSAVAPSLNLQRDIEPNDDVTPVVLAVYAEDAEAKLTELDGLAGRLQCVQDLMNRKLYHKKLTISRSQGFLVTSQNGDVPLGQLSSGEQHQLIMLSELLFKTPEGALVLLDEPEISLNVAWQETFLSDLEKLRSVVPMQFLIATHSPQIVNERWDSDSMVALGGSPNENA